jgi:hypothetical protein
VELVVLVVVTSDLYPLAVHAARPWLVSRHVNNQPSSPSGAPGSSRTSMSYWYSPSPAAGS